MHLLLVREAPSRAYFIEGNAKTGFGATPTPVREAQSGFVDQQVFLDDASSGLNAVLRSLPWQPQDVLLLTSAAYAVLPNTGKWLQKRYDIHIMQAQVHFPASSAEDFVGPVERALSELPLPCKLRLAVFDHVSSYPPAILPVARLARLVKDRCPEALVLLDGAHALGQVPVDMEKLAEAGVDVYVTDGHKWLMAPKGSGALWASGSVQNILEPAIISSDNSPATKFQDRFDYIGTRDYTSWCAMGAALDFRAMLGGEEKLQQYTSNLARWAGNMMADAFGTETVVPGSMTPSMFAVRLPVPLAWPKDVQQECAGLIAGGLIQNFSMQVISFTVSSENENATHWIRVSSQIYLEQADFLALTNAVLTLRQSCKLTAERWWFRV
ncbi:egt2 [Symbiodinium natans]|uniref:Egt2 protein n=1 Tax=Symbiodinium natans TaxID=878477 RepID=A0A812L7W8_9DINO|nr:egt2 [Symbiodinium natans]